MASPLISIERLSDFQDDPRLNTRIKIENYLLVHLGLRSCSQMTLPAELPDADAMGSAIDERIYPKVISIRGETKPRRKLMAIEELKREMRAAYEKIVLTSEQHKAHLEWADTLGLYSRVVDVRPTVQELYLFRGSFVDTRLKRLMREREKLRARAYEHAPPYLDRAHLVYPEEFEAFWLREMGQILGYPNCCIEAYATDREESVNVEKRAAMQIKRAEQASFVDSFAYFVGYFFPCAPDCEEAISKGKKYHEHLTEFAPSLGELYASLVVENLDRVRRQPETISSYRAKAEEMLKRHL